MLKPDSPGFLLPSAFEAREKDANKRTHKKKNIQTYTYTPHIRVNINHTFPEHIHILKHTHRLEKMRQLSLHRTATCSLLPLHPYLLCTCVRMRACVRARPHSTPGVILPTQKHSQLYVISALITSIIGAGNYDNIQAGSTCLPHTRYNNIYDELQLVQLFPNDNS